MRCQVAEVSLVIRNQGNALPIVINQPALIWHARAGGHPAWVLPWSGDSKILDSRFRGNDRILVRCEISYRNY